MDGRDTGVGVHLMTGHPARSSTKPGHKMAILGLEGSGGINLTKCQPAQSTNKLGCKMSLCREQEELWAWGTSDERSSGQNSTKPGHKMSLVEMACGGNYGARGVRRARGTSDQRSSCPK